MKYIEEPVSEFIISDRVLNSKKKGEASLRTLKISLARDKESIAVSLVTRRH